MIDQTFGKTALSPKNLIKAIKTVPTPFYLYDEAFIRSRCREFFAMPQAYGLFPRFAMKANSSRALLQIIQSEGFGIDASSLNEARRAIQAGFSPEKILLTTQEIPNAENRLILEDLMRKGLKYNACSLTQLKLIAPFAQKHALSIGFRIHPGTGSGESVTRNTGDKYSSFGIHLENLDEALSLAKQNNIMINLVHVHIGSGGDPEAWRANIDTEISIIERFFPDVTTVNFGGGFCVARMNDETSANLNDLGLSAQKALFSFYERTGRKLIAEVEPGTYLLANAGYLVNTVMDVKTTGKDGFTFALVDGAMEVLTRPLLYGSRHPITVLSPEGIIKSDELSGFSSLPKEQIVVVGRCCESGDALTLDTEHHINPRAIARPETGDFLVSGGAGAYASSMSPFNYNSHQQAAEILIRESGELKIIRSRQSFEQISQNEMGL